MCCHYPHEPRANVARTSAAVVAAHSVQRFGQLQSFTRVTVFYLSMHFHSHRPKVPRRYFELIRIN